MHRELSCAAVAAYLLLSGPTALATAADADEQCRNLEGMYEFIGELQPDSQRLPAGLAANIAMILYPEVQTAYDERISHYRLLLEDGGYRLELRTPYGILLDHISIAGKRDFSYCLDDVLTIERQKMDKVGSVYRYSRYRHRVRKLADGKLAVETDVRGKFHGEYTSWSFTPERYAARFAPLAPAR